MDYVIIVAGGKGLRMGGDVPKQFMPIAGRPVLMYTIERFKEYDNDLQVILVLPHEQQQYWRDLCRQYSFTVPHIIADGGKERFHSVSNGLALVPHDAQGVVGVHDGVRPFVSTQVIARTYDAARLYGAAIPTTAVVESLRHLTGMPSVSGKGSATQSVPRADYLLVQTPQSFDIQLLKQAYNQPYTSLFTDDASVVEAMGRQIVTVEGNRENIKITTPFDITIAEALLRQ